MSDNTVIRLAEKLNISVDQASAVWQVARQAMYDSIHAGESVDLGFVYLMPALRKSRRRHDFSLNAAVTIPEQHSVKMIVPPHVVGALSGEEALSPFIWLTRSALKGLPQAEKDALRKQNLDYYRLKGVTV